MPNINEYSLILCEGNTNSLDYRIYSAIFEDKLIVPCGANSILKIQEVKLKEYKNACAITDRDIMTKKEIAKLENDNIFCTCVRAVENLLVIDPVLQKICEKLKVKSYMKKIESIKSTLFEKYGKKLNKEFDFEVTKDSILEFYSPKKVIDTVALMLKMSKTEYENAFFELLYLEEVKRAIKKYICTND